MRETKMMVRLNSDERTTLESAATRNGLSLSSWARMELLKVSRTNSALPQKNGRRKDLSLLSLFCGPGGLDEGFRQAGFHTDLAFDVDQESVNTFNSNHQSDRPIAHTRDITKLATTDLDNLIGQAFTPIGVVGGPPCQSFSVSNVHQKDDDPRHSLPIAYARLLQELNARSPLSFFVFENVPGLLGSKHRHRYEKFKKLFRNAGFELFENILDAQDYGVPQVRTRVFIVGINRGLHPNCVWTWPEKEGQPKTVRETIAGLPEPVLNGDDVSVDKIPVHPNHWAMVPRSKKFSTPGALREGQAWGRSFRTLAWDEPSWTVAYGNREVHVHPRGHRRLSMYEAMLLQSFPKHYVLTGTISAQTRLVSEAVPPRLGWHLGIALRRCLGI